MDDKVTRVLLLSANPKDTNQLRLNEEFREIREGLNLSTNRDLFDIKQGGATRAKDLRRLIFSFNPHIVHFSGHSSTDGIFLESDSGRYNLVTGYALANLFSLFSDTVRCVILNACYSRDQAIEIVQQIPYVVGMSTRIRDDSAIQFTIGFYDAIGAGRGIEDAYKFGCNAIQLEGGNNLGGSDRSLILPVSKAGDLEKYSDIDEADKPVLLTRVREIKPSANDEKEAPIHDERKAIPQEKNQPVTLISPPPSQTHKPSKSWLPWALASLVPLIALGFVVWDSQMKTTQDVEQNDIVEQGSIQADSNMENATETLDTEAFRTRERELAQQQAQREEELRQQAEAQKQTQMEKKAHQQAESKEQGAQLQQQKDEQKKVDIKEATRQQRIRDARNAAKEKEITKRERLIRAAEKAQREKQARAAAAKLERLKQQKAEIADLARQKQADLERRQWEDQQRAEAVRRAWKAKQDEKARQQAERRRWEQLQQQKAKAQQAPKQTQPAPSQKESAADRMVKEVEELWFDR